MYFTYRQQYFHILVLAQLSPVILFLPTIACLYSFFLQSLLVSYSWAQLLLMLPGDQCCGEVHRASPPDMVNKELLERVGGCCQQSFGL